MRVSFFLLMTLLVLGCQDPVPEIKYIKLPPIILEEEKAVAMEAIEDLKTGPGKQIITINYKDLIVCIPKDASQEMPVLVVFGGMYYATPKFMKKEMPSIVFKDRIIVFAPCRHEEGRGFRKVRNSYRKVLRQRKITVKTLSVCGFSGGGPDVLEADDPKLKMMGLIDPEPRFPRGMPDDFPRLFMAFNKKNWEKNQSYGEENEYANFELFQAWVSAQSGWVEEADIDHKYFPKYFFYRLRDHL